MLCWCRGASWRYGRSPPQSDNGRGTSSVRTRGLKTHVYFEKTSFATTARRVIIGVFALLLLTGATAIAGRFEVVHSFKGGSDGYEPQGGPIFGNDFNLYGTTGGGTVYKLSPDGTFTSVYLTERGSSVGSLLQDSQDNLYGTTTNGDGYGTVFRLAPDGTETVLHSFCQQTGCSDGACPQAPVIADSAGNLYGTASDYCLGSGYGFGNVFKLAPDGTFTVLHAFTGAPDGDMPMGGLIFDSAGNLYGTTYFGGSCMYSPGCGVIFKIDPDGTETIFHSFSGPDGWKSQGGLIADSAGNFYGMTVYGGNQGDCSFLACGVIFKITPDSTETVLHNFNGADGTELRGTPFLDSAGNLYGVASSGGAYNCGTMFRLKPNDAFKVLHNFKDGRDGCYPMGGLAQDANGYVYGTAYASKAQGSLYKVADKEGTHTLQKGRSRPW